MDMETRPRINWIFSHSILNVPPITCSSTISNAASCLMHWIHTTYARVLLRIALVYLQIQEDAWMAHFTLALQYFHISARVSVTCAWPFSIKLFIWICIFILLLSPNENRFRSTYRSPFVFPLFNACVKTIYDLELNKQLHQSWQFLTLQTH